jgi:hypothetical protein
MTNASTTMTQDSSRASWFSLSAIVISCVLFLWHVYGNWTYLEDDPFIVFRYALNFHAGWGWVMNPGEYVNGCTSFLHLLLVTALTRCFSLDASILIMKLLGVLCGIIVLVKTQQISRKVLPDAPIMASLAPLLIAYRTDFALAMTNCLETPYACVFFLFGLTNFINLATRGESRFNYLSALFFALAALCRPELTVIYPCLVLLMVGNRAKMDLRPLALYCVPILALVLFNAIYYHSALPNTYYAKLVKFTNGLIAGGSYIEQYLCAPLGAASGIVSLFCLVLLFIRRNRVSEILLAVFVLYVCFLLRTCGDWMVDGRFAMPVLPVVVASWLAALREGYQLINKSLGNHKSRVVALCGAAAFVLVVSGFADNKARESYIRSYARIRSYPDRLPQTGPLAQWMCAAPTGRIQISNWIGLHVQPGQTVAMPEIGLITCLNPEVRVLDEQGLTDRAIARMRRYSHGAFGVYAGFDWDNLNSPMGKYIEQRHPDYVIWLRTKSVTPRNNHYFEVASFPIFIDINGYHTYVIYERKRG